MRKSALYPILALGLFAGRDALATNGMRMIGFGPVQNSMGGVGVGLTLDGASVITNPAGMLDAGGGIDFGATFFAPTVKYQATANPMAPPGAVVQSNGYTLTSDKGPSPIPAFGLILPINQSFAFGVGAYGVAGMGVDYKQNLYGGTTYSSYSQMRFAPGISYKINDMFSAGVAVNLMFAQMEFDAAGGLGQQPHMGAGSFGGGATIGVQVKPVKMLTIGLAYETQSFFQDFAFNTPMHTGVNPATFQPIPNIPAGREKLKFNQPSVITLGVGAKPLDALAVGVDVGLIRWSETNGENKPEWTSDANATGTMPWNLNWKDQVVLKVGVQYAVVPWLRVRAGYNYGKMPLDASRAFENIAFPAIAEHHVTAGLGIDTSDKVAINLGGMISPKATLSGSNPDFPAMGGQAIQSYETTMTQMSVDLGVSYKF